MNVGLNVFFLVREKSVPPSLFLFNIPTDGGRWIKEKTIYVVSRVAFQIPAHFCSRCPTSSHPESLSGSRLQHQALGKQLRVSLRFPPTPSSKPQRPLNHLYVESPSVWSDNHRTSWVHTCVEDGPIGFLCRKGSSSLQITPFCFSRGSSGWKPLVLCVVVGSNRPLKGGT